jgi:hypothetical protein
MTLKEFIKEYIGHNSMVRLLYKEKSGGHRIVLNDWDEVSMEWEVFKFCIMETITTIGFISLAGY